MWLSMMTMELSTTMPKTMIKAAKETVKLNAKTLRSQGDDDGDRHRRTPATWRGKGHGHPDDEDGDGSLRKTKIDC